MMKNWWLKVSIALAAPLLARKYEKRAGAADSVDEGGLVGKGWGMDLEDYVGNHAGAKLW